MLVASPGLGNTLLQVGHAFQELMRPFQEIGSVGVDIANGIRNPRQSQGASHSSSTNSTGNSLDRKIKIILLQAHCQVIINKYSPSKGDKLGYLPGIGSVVGVVHILNSLFLLGSALFFKIQEWCARSSQTQFRRVRPKDDDLFAIAMRFLVRGFIELIPVIGGLSLYFYDAHRLYTIYEQTIAQKAHELGIEDFR